MATSFRGALVTTVCCTLLTLACFDSVMEAGAADSVVAGAGSMVSHGTGSTEYLRQGAFPGVPVSAASSTALPVSAASGTGAPVSAASSTALPVSAVSGTGGPLSSSSTITGISSGVSGSIRTKPARLHEHGGTSLLPAAEELAKTIKFDRKVLLIVKEESQERIQRLIGYDADGYQIMAQGISVAVPRDKTDHILAKLRKKLVPLNYLPFVVEINEGLKTDKIGVIQGTDQYEILRIMQTNGDAYDISNDDIVEQLKEWEKICSFFILGAGNDWVEIEFRKLPKDLKSFAGEVYDFSPDAVDQEPGTLDDLVKDMVKTGRLFLSWEE